ncbi:MAG: alpha/beta fold hydrolase [Sandaracinus sp.]|nr:alpha/beta fold hydrolase [Sandaracinus sp.]
MRTALLLHSSGMSSRQWRPLASELAATHEVLAPDLIGSGERPPWTGASFHFREDLDELEAMLRAHGPADLVGHSYGGFLALQLARRAPELVRTLAVYDPVAFGVLNGALPEDLEALATEGRADLARVAEEPRFESHEGDEVWFELFVDYWNGVGAWRALPDHTREAFLRVGRKVFGEVTTLSRDHTPAEAYAVLRAPALLITGERTPPAARAVVAILARTLPNATRLEITGAGHMGPITHARRVVPAIVAHVAA